MRIMLVPGNGDADVDSEIWYPWITKQLKSLGLNIISKNMPDPDLARKEYWLPFIEEQLARDEGAILIGHSSGAIAALRYAETHQLQGIVLVSAYHTNLGMEKEKASHYFDTPWQWDKIKQNVKWIIQLHSTDDPYISNDEAEYIAKKLDTDYHEYTDKGHFEDKEFPELLEMLKKKS